MKHGNRYTNKNGTDVIIYKHDLMKSAGRTNHVILVFQYEVGQKYLHIEMNKFLNSLKRKVWVLEKPGCAVKDLLVDPNM